MCTKPEGSSPEAHPDQRRHLAGTVYEGGEQTTVVVLDGQIRFYQRRAGEALGRVVHAGRPHRQRLGHGRRGRGRGRPGGVLPLRRNGLWQPRQAALPLLRQGARPGKRLVLLRPALLRPLALPLCVRRPAGGPVYRLLATF